jgi:serine/threonine-protein kinase
MADRHVGPFLLGQKLGSGGMGVVYRATFTKTGEIVALKLLAAELEAKPRTVARFERELAILKKLKHPHIVRCLWGGRVDGRYAMAMQFVEGGSLADELRKRGKFSWEEVIRMGQQICSALDHAHGHGIVHRDLKPGNLLLTKDGKVKLADFGIALDSDATPLTAAGKTVGTFSYMSPEQIRGGTPVGPKTDLYALGCVFFELLSGTPPFTGETVGELLYQHIEKKPQRVSAVALDCPVWFDALLQQLLEKDPDKRPHDALAVSSALAEVQAKVANQSAVLTHAASGMPTSLNMTTDDTAIRQLFKRKRRKKAETGPIYERTWFLVLCLAAVVGLVAWSLWPQSEEKMWAKAKVLMESEDPLDWNKANEEYLSKLQAKFPDGQSATFVRDSIDKIKMRKAEDLLMNKMRLGKDPSSEGERLYAQARRYELFGDRVTAVEMYGSMIQVLGDDEESRPYANLARRQKAQIEGASDGKPDRLQIVNAALDKADELYQAGQVVEANKTWNSIISLYENNQELRPLVKKARARLSKKSESGDDPADQ